MPYWKTSHGLVGDGPVNVMCDAIEDIRMHYREDLGRDPSKLELCDLIAVVLETITLVDSFDSNRSKN